MIKRLTNLLDPELRGAAGRFYSRLILFMGYLIPLATFWRAAQIDRRWGLDIAIALGCAWAVGSLWGMRDAQPKR